MRLKKSILKLAVLSTIFFCTKNYADNKVETSTHYSALKKISAREISQLRFKKEDTGNLVKLINLLDLIENEVYLNKNFLRVSTHNIDKNIGRESWTRERIRCHALKHIVEKFYPKAKFFDTLSHLGHENPNFFPEVSSGYRDETFRFEYKDEDETEKEKNINAIQNMFEYANKIYEDVIRIAKEETNYFKYPEVNWEIQTNGILDIKNSNGNSAIPAIFNRFLKEFNYIKMNYKYDDDEVAKRLIIELNQLKVNMADNNVNFISNEINIIQLLNEIMNTSKLGKQNMDKQVKISKTILSKIGTGAEKATLFTTVLKNPKNRKLKKDYMRYLGEVIISEYVSKAIIDTIKYFVRNEGAKIPNQQAIEIYLKNKLERIAGDYNNIQKYYINYLKKNEQNNNLGRLAQTILNFKKENIAQRMETKNLKLELHAFEYNPYSENSKKGLRFFMFIKR